MQKIKYILITIFLSIVMVLALLGYSAKNRKKIEIINKREFSSIKLLDELILNDKYSQIKIYNNNIYLLKVLNNKENKIFKYTPKNNSLKIEHELDKKTIVGGYYITKDNTLFFKDNSSNKLKINKTNKIIYEKEFKIIINRLLMINENLSLITTWNNNYKPLFYKYNVNKDLLEEIKIDNDVYKNLKYPGIELDGKLINNNNFIYLIPYGQNLVLVFDKEINFVKSFELNFKTTNFDIINGENQTLIDPNNIYPNFSATTDNNYIYILTNERGKIEDRKNYYIDIYNIKNSKYEKSFKIDSKDNNPPKEIAVNNNMIYLLNEKTITIYDKSKL